MRTSDRLISWANEPQGFLWFGEKGWRDVQATAFAYLIDERRWSDPAAWTASIERFVAAAEKAMSEQWTCDPGTDALFYEAVRFEDMLPLPIKWENKVPPFNVYGRRSA